MGYIVLVTKPHFYHHHSTKVKLNQHHKYRIGFTNDLVPHVLEKYLNAGKFDKKITNSKSRSKWTWPSESSMFGVGN
jgi:hypothetical protein